MEEQKIKSSGIKKTYTVKEDESLTIIAREFYGNPSLWKHIYEANIDKIKDPNDLQAGQKLIIPNLPK
ncbi:LysM peptidoglycan-binding domain-containing protein [Fulvivirga ulvae]|uniref:LysM peptidoglycan-binding domain-containing protein n=1 Tax=Fulvivirga ulvae TaxID=2904245 RepID=UPI001F2C27CB|nr:LysM peptidoglycan-binding domain-containing protein [Fulvivirga ulvae]UII33195.1 LysM peptidoglycan-binding domain-containing protein [Fulvivirga ulvae]